MLRASGSRSSPARGSRRKPDHRVSRSVPPQSPPRHWHLTPRGPARDAAALPVDASGPEDAMDLEPDAVRSPQRSLGSAHAAPQPTSAEQLADPGSTDGEKAPGSVLGTGRGTGRGIDRRSRTVSPAAARPPPPLLRARSHDAVLLRRAPIHRGQRYTEPRGEDDAGRMDVDDQVASRPPAPRAVLRSGSVPPSKPSPVAPRFLRSGTEPPVSRRAMTPSQETEPSDFEGLGSATEVDENMAVSAHGLTPPSLSTALTAVGGLPAYWPPGAEPPRGRKRAASSPPREILASPPSRLQPAGRSYQAVHVGLLDDDEEGPAAGPPGFVPSVLPPKRKHHHRAKRDPNQPPRPPNMWILYRTDARAKLMAEYDEKKEKPPPESQISRILGDRWKREGPDVRAVYERRAEQALVEHRILYPDYKYKPQKNEETEWTLYRRDHINALKASDRRLSVPHEPGLTEMLADQWRKESPEVLVKYRRMVEDLKEGPEEAARPQRTARFSKASDQVQPPSAPDLRLMALGAFAGHQLNVFHVDDVPSGSGARRPSTTPTTGPTSSSSGPAVPSRGPNLDFSAPLPRRASEMLRPFHSEGIRDLGADRRHSAASTYEAPLPRSPPSASAHQPLRQEADPSRGGETFRSPRRDLSHPPTLPPLASQFSPRLRERSPHARERDPSRIDFTDPFGRGGRRMAGRLAGDVAGPMLPPMDPCRAHSMSGPASTLRGASARSSTFPHPVPRRGSGTRLPSIRQALEAAHRETSAEDAHWHRRATLPAYLPADPAREGFPERGYPAQEARNPAWAPRGRRWPEPPPPGARPYPDPRR